MSPAPSAPQVPATKGVVIAGLTGPPRPPRGLPSFIRAVGALPSLPQRPVASPLSVLGCQGQGVLEFPQQQCWPLVQTHPQSRVKVTHGNRTCAVWGGACFGCFCKNPTGVGGSHVGPHRAHISTSELYTHWTSATSLGTGDPQPPRPSQSLEEEGAWRVLMQGAMGERLCW